MNRSSGAKRQELILPSQECEAPEIGIWLGALSDCRARTHKAIAGIQQDELDWKNPLNRNTIGTLLYHIAAIELDWLYCEVLEQEFPDYFRTWFPYDVHDAQGNNQIVVGDSAQRHMERLQYVRDKLVGSLSLMSPAEFRRVRHLKAYDVTTEWVVHHLLQHEAEHRGQIEILRRHFKDANSAPVALS